MAGIVSFGAYVPLYRLGREHLASTWGGSAAPGEKSVANADEDSITMGVEAATDCIRKFPKDSVDGIYFASTSPPYIEKQSASIIAAALDLREDILTADFANSMRAGTNALRAALDTVAAGSAKNILVVVSENRIPAPNSEYEPLFGDGAAAFLVGNEGVTVQVEGVQSITSEFMDLWKLPRERFQRTWEDRFVVEEGYLKIIPQAVAAFLKKSGLTVKDFNKAVFYGPDARRHGDIAKKLGVDPKTQVQDPMFDRLGNTGCAFALMMLVAALEEAKAGDRLLFVSYGDGCDVFSLKAGDNIKTAQDIRGIKKHLESKALLPNYGKYVRFRELMEWEADRRPADTSALTVLWRERNQILRFHGSKCNVCGTIQYPLQRVCAQCQAKDDYEEIRLADKIGDLFTFSMDVRAMVKDLPNVMAIVDFEIGGRFYCILTDRDPDKVEVGMKVEMTFRNLHDGSGIHNYYWKARPIRC
ncbi:MAG: 3-oxoacyl-[acyl-carrier-protein] synthase III C-terminal domain-containing protein [Dehalococcoidia bacterium]|nr:3-oxoacyl-[acyl-carrier-protein] synthase III C-terminal domain-containing protein [Dehalococcoidia bacterium]